MNKEEEVARKREDSKVQILHDIRRVLSCHQANSISSYPGGPELVSFLESRLPIPAPRVSPGPLAEEEIKVLETSGPGPRSACDLSALGDIAAEVAVCQRCSLAGQRSMTMAGHWGGGTIRLLVIGHWLSVNPGEKIQCVFGPEEDHMLARMLTAIQLSQKEVFVTNVVKCGVAPKSRPQGEHVEACAPYLLRQIQALAPQVICTMGIVATKYLLRPTQSLSALRGRFHSYQGPEGAAIPVLPTYHPSFLLQNPEMKGATWQDLQMIQRLLQKGP